MAWFCYCLLSLIYITAHWRHDGQDGGGHHRQPQRLDRRGADRPECVQV